MNTDSNPAKGISARFMRVTPRIAQTMLEHNSNNRKIRSRYVDRLAKEINNGDFYLTHQGIAFNCDGTLIDGQHRLEAVVRADKPVWLLVVKGLPKKTASAIDCGATRSVGDAIAIVDGVNFPNMNRIVAASVAMMTTWRTDHPTRQEQLHFFKAHRSAIDAAWTMYPTSRRGLCRAGVLGAIAAATYHVAKAKLARFCEVLQDGIAETREERSILKLRDFLISGSKRAGEVSRIEDYMKTQRTIRSYLDGEQINRLTAATEDLFPIPV